MVKVFANGPGDLGSIPGCVIPNTFKMVLDTSLLNTQQYKIRIKGKVEQFRELRPPLQVGVVAIEKGALWSPTLLFISNISKSESHPFFYYSSLVSEFLAWCLKYSGIRPGFSTLVINLRRLPSIFLELINFYKQEYKEHYDNSIIITNHAITMKKLEENFLSIPLEYVNYIPGKGVRQLKKEISLIWN